MGIISRHARKLGVVVAGAALLVGTVGVPSALADDAHTLTTQPASGFIQSDSDQTIVVSGDGCTGDNEFGYTIGLHAGEGAGLLPEDTVKDDGTWSIEFSVGDFETPGSDGIGWWARVSATCVANPDPADDQGQSTLVFTYDSVDIAVTDFYTEGGPTNEDIPVEADGFAPGETVTFTLSDGQTTGVTPGLIGTGTADDVYGHVATTIKVPTDTPTDTYTLTVKGSTSGRTFISSIEITEQLAGPAEETTTSGPSVNSGGTIAPVNTLPALGLGLLMLGAGALLARRATGH